MHVWVTFEVSAIKIEQESQEMYGTAKAQQWFWI